MRLSARAKVADFTALDHPGSPSSLCVDVEGAVFVCDVAHQAVFRHGEDGQLSEFVKEYEAKPFKGPSAMLLDSAGNMFFTDSGPLGETTLQSPKGSVFLISADGQLLQPLLLEALAHPCALALGLDERVIFVAEKMQVLYTYYDYTYCGCPCHGHAGSTLQVGQSGVLTSALLRCRTGCCGWCSDPLASTTAASSTSSADASGRAASLAIRRATST